MMMRRIAGGAIVSLFAAAPALAVGPSCAAQLEQISALMRQQSNVGAALKAKYDYAQQLCNQHQEEQAQDIARQLRSELTPDSGAGEAKSGSSSPSTSSTGVQPPK